MLFLGGYIKADEIVPKALFVYKFDGVGTFKASIRNGKVTLFSVDGQKNLSFVYRDEVFIDGAKLKEDLANVLNVRLENIEWV